MSIQSILVAVAAMSLVILACRAFPFLFSFGHNRVIGFIERFVPPVAMTVLAVSALAQVKWTESPFGIPEAAASIVVVVVHVWKRNALLSIVGGTAVFMAMKAMC